MAALEPSQEGRKNSFPMERLHSLRFSFEFFTNCFIIFPQFLQEDSLA